MDSLSELAKARSQRPSAHAASRIPLPLPKQPAGYRNWVLASLAMATIILLGGGLIAWMLTGATEHLPRVPPVQMPPFAAVTSAPFRIEITNAQKDEFAFKMVATSERPFMVYRVSFNGEHREEGQNLPWKLTIGEEARLRMNADYRDWFARQLEGGDDLKPPRSYDKHVIFIDIDTDMGGFRYNVGSGETVTR